MKIGYLMQAGVPDIRDEPLSGPANHVKHVFYELQAMGHEVRLVAQLDGDFWASDDLINLRRIEVRRRHEWLWRNSEKMIRRIQGALQLPYAAWFESQRFSCACQQELDGFDILYERMGWMGYGGGIAAVRMNIPWVLEVNGDHLDELKSLGLAPTGGQEWLSMWVMQRAIRRVAHVVAVGEGWMQRFLDRWGFERERMSVVENGSEMVDRLDRSRLFSYQPGTSSSTPLCSSQGNVELFSKTTTASTSPQPVQVIYIGGFEPWHGVTVLIEAVAQALSRNAPIQLLLIGSGSQLTQIESMIDDLKLHSYITLAGYLSSPEMVPYLEQAEIGVCPYQERANFSGLKILDYKAAGLATIASGQNGEPSILTHGQTGLIVPPSDVDRLADALVQLSQDVELRRGMGQAARAEAESTHRWHHTAKQLDGVFGLIINHQRRSNVRL